MWDLNEESNGGSPFLQAKIYWATNRVEHAFSKGELKDESGAADDSASMADAMMSSASKSAADSTTPPPNDDSTKK
jgi:hypothetical protein